MRDTLSSLAYVSRIAITGGPAAVATGIGTILVASRRRNRVLGITGALLFTEGNFAQVLEGAQAAVEEVFEAIECDHRHAGVTLLHFHPVAARSFAGWDMAYAGGDAAHPGMPGPAGLPAGGHGFIEVLLDYIQRAAARPPPG